MYMERSAYSQPMHHERWRWKQIQGSKHRTITQRPQRHPQRSWRLPGSSPLASYTPGHTSLEHRQVKRSLGMVCEEERVGGEYGFGLELHGVGRCTCLFTILLVLLLNETTTDGIPSTWFSSQWAWRRFKPLSYLHPEPTLHPHHHPQSTRPARTWGDISTALRTSSHLYVPRHTLFFNHARVFFPP